MKPFYDKGQFNSRPALSSSSPKFIPKKIGYGIEIRTGKDVAKRKLSLFISSGKWAEMPDDGLIDQEVSPAVMGESIDILNISPYIDQNERKSVSSVLESGEIIQSQTIDFEGETSKDGRITIFSINAREYISRQEIPYSSRGFKVKNETILGYSTGKTTDPFLDGGDSSLGVTREGFYGKSAKVIQLFEDRSNTDGLGNEIDTGDFNEEYQTGAFGFSLYSSEFGTDSVAFAGFLK